jgi:hypothetical protein
MRSTVLNLRKSNNIQRTLLVILYTILCKMTFLDLLVWTLKMPCRISYSIKYTTLSLHIYDCHGALMLKWSLFQTLALHISHVYCWQLGDPCCLHFHRHDHPITLPVLITQVCVSVGTDPLDSSSDNVRQKWVIGNSSIWFIKWQVIQREREIWAFAF